MYSQALVLTHQGRSIFGAQFDHATRARPNLGSGTRERARIRYASAVRLMILAVVWLVGGSARADDKANLAAARKVLEAQLHGDLDDSPPTTSRYVGVVPGHFGDGDVTRWRFGPPYIGTIKIEKSAAGWSGSWGWIAADLAVMQRPYAPEGFSAKARLHRYHLVEVFVLEGTAVKLEATLLADTMDDAKLPVVQHTPGGPPKGNSLLGALVSPGSVKLLANPNVAVLGSSAGEAAFGAVAAKKLLGTWAKLQLSMTTTPPKELAAGDLGIAFAEVDLVVNKTSRRLRAMVVAKKTGAGWEVATLAFGTDTPVGDPKIPDSSEP